MVRDRRARPHLQDRGREVRGARRRHPGALRPRASRCSSARSRWRRASCSPTCSTSAASRTTVLNAKKHEQEAVVVTQAGRLDAVTVATNMAGRGVDILLGGNPEGLATEELARQRHRRPRRTPRSSTRSSPSSRSSAPRRATASASSAASTCSAPSGTRAAGSTTSSVAVPAVRATRARAASTSRSRTSSCGSSRPAR